MESINLVKIVDGKIVLNEAAVLELEKNEGPISIVSTCGDYRTGKSFLLNMLFSLNCFDVSPTTEPCTKGINMSKMPIQIYGKKLWIFDTEGFGSMQQQGRYDAKIFLLTILFSQALIYNSVSSLDQPSISKMALMCKQAMGVCKQLQQENQNQSQSQIISGQAYFYWVLRDFALSLANKNGQNIDPDQYLEQSLSGESAQRKTIKRLFSKRKCFTLVRPCISETNLQSLKTIPVTEIRGQFKQEIENLFKHILQHIQPKKLLGKQLNGIQFVKLMKTYIKAINQSELDTNLTVTWQKIQDYQRQMLLQNIEQQTESKIKRYQKNIPISELNMKKLKKQINEVLKKDLFSLKQSLMDVKIQKIVQQRLQKFQQKNNKFFKQQFDKFKVQNLGNFFIRLQKASLTIREQFPKWFLQQLQCINDEYLNTSKDFFNKQLSTRLHLSLLNQIMVWLNEKILNKLTTDLCFKQKHIQTVERQKAELQDELRRNTKREEELYLQIKKMKKAEQDYDQKQYNYQEIIRRLQRVNDNLRKEFQKLQANQKQEKSDLQIKIIQYQQRIIDMQRLCQDFQNKLRESQEQKGKMTLFIDNMRQDHKIQQQEAAKDFLHMIERQRQSFQSLLEEKRLQQSNLQQQIQQAHFKNGQFHEQFKQKILKIQRQYESIIEQKENKHKIDMDRLYIAVNQVSNRQGLLKIQNQRLYQEIDLKMAKVEELNEEICSCKKRFKDIQNQCISLQQQVKRYQQQLATQKSNSEQNKLKNMQICQELKQNHKAELQNLTGKLQQSIQSNVKASKQKYELSKKQYQIQQNKIADKLIQAAERISVMTEKQKTMSLKIDQSEKKLQSKDRLYQQLENKYQQLRENYEKKCQQFQEIQNQLDQHLQQPKNIELFRILRLKNQLGPQQRQLAYSLSSVERANRQKSQRSKSKSKSKRTQLSNNQIEQSNQNYNPQMQAGYSNADMQMHIRSLLVQNQILRNQIQDQRNKAQKWKVESLKKINLHSLMKKMQTGDVEEFYHDEQNNQNQKKLFELQSLLSRQKQRTTDLNHQISQLHQVILSLSQDLKNTEQNSQLTKLTLQQVLEEKQKIREAAEKTKASNEVNTRILTSQIEQLRKKCNGWAKQVSIWRMKDSSISSAKKDGQLTAQSSNYRGKINELFNFL